MFDKIGVKTGIDFFDIADAAEEVVAPAMPAECLLDRNALIMGYSGVYSSFLKHAIRQSERYGVPAHKLLHRAGQRKLIGGQEDQLIDIALEIKREQDAGQPGLPRELVGPAGHDGAMATRDDAQAILEQLAGPDAVLRDDQWTGHRGAGRRSAGGRWSCSAPAGASRRCTSSPPNCSAPPGTGRR